MLAPRRKSKDVTRGSGVLNASRTVTGHDDPTVLREGRGMEVPRSDRSDAPPAVDVELSSAVVPGRHLELKRTPLIVRGSS